MSQTGNPPELSAIVMSQGPYDEALRRLIRAWSKQRVKDKIEVVFVCPSKQDFDLAERDLAGFAGWQVVEIGALRSTSVVRSEGIRAASAPIIALTEDHCFPNSAWAEAIISRHREGWTGVGPVFVNANPHSAISWANFLLEYGDWIDANHGGERSHIPGHNSSYKRDALLEYGQNLPDFLEAESTMQWEMRARGHRFCLEPQARSVHFNFSRIGPSIELRFYAGRLFAANRARRWSVPRRLLYALGSPLIPAVRFVRILKAAGSAISWRRPALLPIMLMLLVIDGLGEMVGYAMGSGDSMQQLSDFGEFQRIRFLTESDQRLLGRFAGVTRVA